MVLLLLLSVNLLRALNQHVDYSGAYNWGCSLLYWSGVPPHPTPPKKHYLSLGYVSPSVVVRSFSMTSENHGGQRSVIHWSGKVSGRNSSVTVTLTVIYSVKQPQSVLSLWGVCMA